MRGGVPVAYDFDDAVYLPQEGGRGWLERLRAPRATTEALCRAATVVFAGNPHLADFARSALGPTASERVQVVPTVVDTGAFRPPEARAADALPTLGWIGSESTVRYLEALAPALRALAGRVPHRLVTVAGATPPRLPGVRFEHRVWTPGDEVRLIQEMDVGLYPLTESPWSLGKCGFKALQYLACGVPCVASPVGVLREIVRPGETGLHATDDAAWVDACVRLLSDAGERARLGRAGRALVEASYSTAAWVPRIAEALRGAAGGRGG